MKCEYCNEEIQAGWKACPFCGKEIRQVIRCKNCDAELQTGWVLCPFCQTPVDQEFQQTNKSITDVSIGDVVRGNIHIDQSSKIEHHLHEAQDLTVKRTITVEGERCEICGTLVKEDYFTCPRCKRDYLCLDHRCKSPEFYNSHEYICSYCNKELINIKNTEDLINRNEWEKALLLLKATREVAIDSSVIDDKLQLVERKYNDHFPLIERAKNKDIFVACEENDIELVKYFLSTGININKHLLINEYTSKKELDNDIEERRSIYNEVNMVFDENDYLKTYRIPLNYAMLGNSVDVALYLLKNGADPCGDGEHCEFPFITAIKANAKECIEILLEQQLSNDYTSTGLDLITKHDNVELLELVIPYCSDTKELIQALSNSCSNNSIKCVEFLLSKNINPMAENKYGKTAMIEAIDNLNYEVCNIIVKRIDEKELFKSLKYISDVGMLIDEDDYEIDYDEALEKYHKIYLLLINSFENVNAKDSDDISILHYAVESHELDHVKCIVERGIDIDILSNGTTALNEAVDKARYDEEFFDDYYHIVKYLIEKGANPLTKGSDDDLCAVENGDWDDGDNLSLKIALEKSVHFDSYRELYGDKFNLELVYDKLILDDDDFNSTYSDNDSNQLKDNISEMARNKSIYEACYENNIELVQYYIDNGANLEIRDWDNKRGTPLIIAIKNNNLGVVELLIENNADVNTSVLMENGNFRRPMDVAISSNNIEAVKMLLSKGITDINNYLVQLAKEDNIDIFNIFIENGADINYVGCDRISVLAWAVLSDSYNITRLLLEKGVNTNTGGYSLLKIAKNNRNNEMIELLKSHGIKGKIRDWMP